MIWQAATATTATTAVAAATTTTSTTTAPSWLGHRQTRFCLFCKQAFGIAVTHNFPACLLPACLTAVAVAVAVVVAAATVAAAGSDCVAAGAAFLNACYFAVKGRVRKTHRTHNTHLAPRSLHHAPRTTRSTVLMASFRGFYFFQVHFRAHSFRFSQSTHRNRVWACVLAPRPGALIAFKVTACPNMSNLVRQSCRVAIAWNSAWARRSLPVGE